MVNFLQNVHKYTITMDKPFYKKQFDKVMYLEKKWVKMFKFKKILVYIHFYYYSF